MKVICGKNALVESINIASRAVSSKVAMPILECCLLTAEAGVGLKLTANDGEMAIETKPIEAEVVEGGAVALDAGVFFDIVRRLPGKSVEISCDDKNLTVIRSDKSEFKILGMDGSDFPEMPVVLEEVGGGFTLPSVGLKNMIRQTIFSVSQDTSKPVLCGELLEIVDGTVRLVSVDGFRISLRKSDFEAGVTTGARVVIPGKALSEISKILPTDGDATVSFFTQDNHILFEMGNCVVVSRLLEGEFINYENMLVKEAETTIVVNRAEFLESIERAALISRDTKKSPVKLKLEEGQIVITSNTEMGTSYEEVHAEQDGPGLEIAFNPRYITDVLKVLECERIVMEFTSALSPCIIKVEDSDDYKYLVLPLRLRN